MRSSDDDSLRTTDTGTGRADHIPRAFADDSPLVGASPWQASLRFWKRYPVFTGRASRSEFWWWALVNAVITLALLAIGRAVDVSSGITAGFWVGDLSEPPAWGAQSILYGVWGLATIIPGLSLGARRMHDTDHSGWWQLITLFPFFGWFFFIWLAAQPSDPSGARYDTGPDREPKGNPSVHRP